MKKKRIIILSIFLVLVLCLTGCISGELLPLELLEITECTRYVEFDPETVTKWREEEESTSAPEIGSLENEDMTMRTYRKIGIGYRSGARRTNLTCIKFDIEADAACALNIVIRDADDRSKEPIFDKIFNLTAGKAQSVIIADFVFTNGENLYIYNECPETVEPVDYLAFFVNWRIEYLQIVGEYK